MFLMSVTGAIGNIEFTTYLKEKIADDMIGKISGISYTMTIGACAIGPVFGGYAVQESNVQDAVFILLIIVALMAFVSLLVFKKPSHSAFSKSESKPLPAVCATVEGTESLRPAPVPIVAADRGVAGIARCNLNVATTRCGNPFWIENSRPSSTMDK